MIESRSLIVKALYALELSLGIESSEVSHAVPLNITSPIGIIEIMGLKWYNVYLSRVN